MWGGQQRQGKVKHNGRTEADLEGGGEDHTGGDVTTINRNKGQGRGKGQMQVMDKEELIGWHDSPTCRPADSARQEITYAFVAPQVGADRETASAALALALVC